MNGPAPERAALVVGCGDLDEAVEACRGAGFRLDAIGPADSPTWAEMSQPGLTVILDQQRGAGAGPALRLPEFGHGDRLLGMAVEPTGPAPADGDPAGRPIERVGRGPDRPVVPATVPCAVVGHEAGGDWKIGRANMRYRDLIPDRYGGAYIASHIHVPDGGPVPDYVHYHDVAHQFIYCHRGWVEVVYQDQGPPFVLEPGDCVLQPPGIRHRVLAASDDLYVVEVGCPAVHRTSVDHDLELPNHDLEPAKRYGGQRFVRHVASRTRWGPGPASGFEHQDTGLGEASDGLVSVHRVRRSPAEHPEETDRPEPTWDLQHHDDLRLLFVTAGMAALHHPNDAVVDLTEGSNVAIPAGEHFRLDRCSRDLTVLDVRATRFSG